jgi:phosphatidylserine/phosphatidylglycerophosphate/cardiolipin synthase-like enzyme
VGTKLRVHQNGDDVFLTWRTDEPVAECLGFAILRRLNGAAAAPLLSYAGFEDQDWHAGDHEPSDVWPIQKYWWTDYTASAGDTVSYRIVPMVAAPDGTLRQRLSDASGWSTPRTLDHEVSPGMSVFFNRGIVASQFAQRLLGAQLTLAQRRARLDKVITDLEHPEPRNVLAGELRIGLRSLLADARAGGRRVRAVLFELTDAELVADLLALGPLVEVVLADGSPNDEKPAKLPAGPITAGLGTKDDENAGSRALLKAAGIVVHDRMSTLPASHPDKTVGGFLAHNKFVVVCDTGGSPRQVWTGSLNWTATGLCSQANNGILIDDPNVAKRFQRQFDALVAAGSDAPVSLRAANTAFGASNASGNNSLGSRKVTTWFTRTLDQVDLNDAKHRVRDAKDGALFLMFKTGATKSLYETIMARRDEPGFFVHGILSEEPTVGGTPDPNPPEQDPLDRQIGFVHKNGRLKYAPSVLLPFALGPSERWIQEFVKKNGAHAIIHSKVVVLDPFGDTPVVITGSHNLGTTASKTNDENLLLISNDRALAAAYVANIMAIYDNFRWRFRVADGSTWKGSSRRPSWQNRYFAGDVPEFQFFKTA